MEIVNNPIAEKIVGYTFARVGQWLCYSFHYDSNMENLKNQEERLRNFKNKVQHSVDAASRNGEEIEGHVQTWLEKVDEATTKLNEIEAKAGNRSSNAACLNLKHRHQLSREAKKMVENIDQLLDEYHKNGNFEKVSHRPPPKGMETTRTMDYMAMDSRMTAVNDIMEALGNADIDKIGVWGMPGVGKSTLMKEIARQAMEEKLFNEVVMAVVTTSPDGRRIQERIAFTLGLNFDQQTDEEGRASQLKQRISSKDKKILVILDDIWKELDLQEIGIPSEGCKVVMTSRDRNVLVSKMDAQKDIELKILQEAEAFNLIEKIAGDSFKDQPEVRGIATEIAKKCPGLPIALVTVSKALKNKSLSEWRDILRQLKRPAPEHITEMTLKTIYSPIEVSYNNLESPELKSLFLLCALSPYFLSYRDLLIYSYGWGLFQGIYTLEEARDRLDRRLRELKDSCLLLEGSDVFCMHDLVRGVATIIASKDNNMFVMRDEGGLKEWPDVDALKRCQAFSTFDQPPNEMECPKLIFFLISSKSSLQIPNTLFQGMEKLKVLDLTEMRLPSLPSSLLVLRNLQTLCLDGCMLEDISGIGELKNLVVLSLLHSEISKLPREIGSLVHLQMLDLSNCSKLEMIPPNVISSWVKLEELYMGNSFVQWEVEGLNDERKNASLTELKHLSNLNTLEIQIPDVSKLPKDFNFEKLERYKICIGDVWHWSYSLQSSRTLKLKLNSSIQSEFWNKMPLKRLEILQICQGELPLTSFKNLKVLKLHNCQKLRFVFSSSIARGLSLLEKLEIKECNNMGAIVVKEEKDGIEDGDVILFHQLQTLVLEDLREFVSFLSTKSSFTTDCGQIIAEGNHDLHMPLLHHQASFPSLDTFYIHRMEKLEIIWYGQVAASLTTLRISDCGSLEAVFEQHEGQNGKESRALRATQRLREMSLSSLPKLRNIWNIKDSHQSHMYSFPNLLEINVNKCNSLKSLFPAALVAASLPQLQSLMIEDYGVLEEIFGAEGGEAIGRTLVFEFPQVTSLHLTNLPRLECFYKGVHLSKWPMLKKMSIEGCEKVEVFASRLVSFEETVEERQYFHMSIKQPLFLVDEMPFPSLEILRIHEMEKLEIIWNIKDSPQRHMYSFPNLLHIDVSLCESLKSLFPSALVAASLPQLQSIMITGCVVMEEIVEREDGTDPKTRLLFPSLICLGLYGLPKLKWFFQGVSTLESSSSMELHEQGGTLFMVEEVAFPNLKLLDLYGLPKIKHIWNKDSQTIRSFQNLQVIIAGKCVSLKSLFPVSIVRCLEQLEKIKVYDCGLEEIVAAEGGAVVEMTVVFPRVTSLCLENLGGLKGVDDSKWLMPKEMQVLECENVKLSFPSLVTLEIRRMYKLEIMSRNVTIRKLWRSCYARCLHAIESYRLRRALRPHATLYEVNKMAYVSYGFFKINV